METETSEIDREITLVTMPDIFRLVLSLFPLRQTFAMRRVCKQWKNLIEQNFDFTSILIGRLRRGERLNQEFVQCVAKSSFFNAQLDRNWVFCLTQALYYPSFVLLSLHTPKMKHLLASNGQYHSHITGKRK
jgi:hypothetical protein